MSAMASAQTMAKLIAADIYQRFGPLPQSKARLSVGRATPPAGEARWSDDEYSDVSSVAPEAPPRPRLNFILTKVTDMEDKSIPHDLAQSMRMLDNQLSVEHDEDIYREQVALLKEQYPLFADELDKHMTRAITEFGTAVKAPADVSDRRSCLPKLCQMGITKRADYKRWAVSTSGHPDKGGDHDTFAEVTTCVAENEDVADNYCRP